MMTTGRRTAWAALLCLWAGTPLVAQVEDPDHFGYLDVFELEVAADPRISPDGRRLLYVSSLDGPSDGYPMYYKYWLPGPPWEGDNQAHYWARSPLSLVGNVTTPTMLLTGELDMRTPMAETEQFYQALKLRKIDTQMVRIQGAYHGIVARPSNLIAKIAYIARWFERYRTDDPAVSD